MHKFKEHQSVVLLRDLDESELWDRGPGRIGMAGGRPVVLKGTHAFIVDLPSQEEFMLEVMDDEGWTIGLADVRAEDVRPAVPSDYPVQVSTDPPA
jgi:hypothetical protein